MKNFSDLELAPKLLEAVGNASYHTPTPIQAQSIPHILERKDILGIAQTGTGKTASFVLPILHFLEQKKARARLPRFLILEPTRELATQVADSFKQFAVNPAPKVSLLIGGVSFDRQEKLLDRGADVIIATPGRLLDHFKKGKILLNGIEMWVVDEADRMLDMGFIPDIEEISSFLPKRRQSLLFSATMPSEIEQITNRFLTDHISITVSPTSSTAKTIEQYLVKAGKKDWEKRAVLREILKNEAENIQNAIIFCNRKKDVITLFRSMEKYGFNAGTLHGDMDQSARSMILTNFKEGRLKFLIASDIAARGLDIPEVSHVVNFDVPTQPEDYVHRIGRTGRAGREGKAFTIVTNNDDKLLKAIEKMTEENFNWLKVETPSENNSKPTNKTKAKPSSKVASNNDATEDKVENTVNNKPEKKEPNKAKNSKEVSSKKTDNKAQAMKNQTTNKIEQKDSSKNRAGNRDKENQPIRGFGADIPAFMLIEVK